LRYGIALIATAGCLTLGLTLTASAGGQTPAKEGPAASTAHRALTSDRDVGETIPPNPPRACDTAWCDKVRTTRKLAIRLYRGLRAWEQAGGNVSPLSDYNVLFPIVRAGRAEGISPLLLVAISGKESSFGVNACGFNTTGLGSCWAAGNWSTITLCGRTFHGPSYVSSYARGMHLTARLIRCLLPDARSVWSLNGYAASSSWKPAVVSILAQWFRAPDHVTWAQAVRAMA
jgi:hypothetical protein